MDGNDRFRRCEHPIDRRGGMMKYVLRVCASQCACRLLLSLEVTRDKEIACEENHARGNPSAWIHTRVEPHVRDTACA